MIDRYIDRYIHKSYIYIYIYIYIHLYMHTQTHAQTLCLSHTQALKVEVRGSAAVEVGRENALFVAQHIFTAAGPHVLTGVRVCACACACVCVCM